MKPFLILSMAILLSCTGSSKFRKLDSLPDKSKFITYAIFWADNGSDSTNIKLRQKIHNISNTFINITDPIWLGTGGYPVCEDSIRGKLPLLFEYMPGGALSKITLSPDEEIIAPCMPLKKCFNLNQPGVYFIWFEYNGSIYSLNNRPFTNDKPIKSNIIRIVIP